jgi:hypothetical protein
MKKYFASFVFLFALAASAHAQLSSNCSSPDPSSLYDYAQTPPIPPAIKALGFPDVVTCGSEENATVTYTVQVLENDICINTSNDTVYAQSNRTTFGVGIEYCTWSMLFGSGNLMCDPRLEDAATTATNSTDYNRFYIRAYDAIDGKYCGTVTSLSRQDFWQCKGVECVVYTCTICPKLPTSCCTCPCGSPIVLDISGQGYNLTSAAQGVMFDLKGDGKLWQMAWTAKGANNAFLALPGADGLVHSGQQLFGNFTPQPKSDTPNGFSALAVYDLPANGGNGDGIIDARDAIFSSLRLWIDANHDGISQPEELHTLPSLGINSIGLAYKASEKTDQYGNVFEYRAQLNPDKQTDAGKTAYDIFFVVQGPTASAQGKTCPVPGAKPSPVIVKR